MTTKPTNVVTHNPIMIIKEMPIGDRPRERFLKQGPQALSDSELIAILLRTGTRGKKGERGENVIEMSNRLINEYGLNKLLECSLTELQKINGIGPSKAMQILTISELQKRINQSKTPINRITQASDVFDLFHERLKNEKQEHFYIIMLSTRNHIIGEHLVSKGVLDAAIIEPREVFRPAIKAAASRIIILHNHPSGDPTPSPEDLEVTKKLIEAGNTVNIKLLDHVIIGNGKWWNWAENSK